METRNCLNHLTAADVNLIVSKYYDIPNKITVDHYNLRFASDKMLGCLGEYWKLKVCVVQENNERNILSFFIKAVSRTNAAKANIARELQLFRKETFFYAVLKNKMHVPDLKPWSANFITALDEAIVLQDLNVLNYVTRNILLGFDLSHTLCALETLARFHAASILLEENNRNILGRPYNIQKEFDQYLDKCGYTKTGSWFNECMNGALEATQAFSKYATEENFERIKSNWRNVWLSSLELSNYSRKYRNVICHRDLWNNNILFKYKDFENSFVPDDCLIVDYQATTCQPPAGDVMVLLYCNVDHQSREQNMSVYLNHYYNTLQEILEDNNIVMDDILPKPAFFQSAEEQRLWGLIVSACLIPQNWINEDLATEVFSNTNNFEEILLKNKGNFIKNMMEVNIDYKKKVLEIFHEIIERFILPLTDDN